MSLIHTDHADEQELVTYNATLAVQPEIRFVAVSTAHLFIVSVALGLLVVVTIVGNCLVITAIIWNVKLRQPSNVLIASLAVADLLVGLFVMPVAILNSISKMWFLGPIVCDLFTATDVFCCTSSILNLVAIAVDRLWAVTDFTYAKTRTYLKMFAMAALAWLLSLGIAIAPMCGLRGDEVNDPNVTGLCLISQNKIYTIISVSCAFYLPSFVILIIYLKIYWVSRARLIKRQSRSTLHRFPELTSAAAMTTPVSGRAGLHSHGSAASLRKMKRQVHGIETPDTNDLLDTPRRKSLVNDEASRQLLEQRLSSINSLHLNDATPMSRRSPRKVRIRMLPANSRVAQAMKTDAVKFAARRRSAAAVLRRSSNHSHATTATNLTVETARCDELFRNLSFCMGRNRYESRTESPLDSAVCSAAAAPSTAPGSEPMRAKAIPLKGSVMSRQEEMAKQIQRAKRLKQFLKERKTSLTLAILTTVFMISWLPFFVLAALMPFCGVVCHTSLTLEMLFTVFTWFGYANSAVNPIIYSIFNVDFRLTFRRLLTAEFLTNRHSQRRRGQFSLAASNVSSPARFTRQQRSRTHQENSK